MTGSSSARPLSAAAPPFLPAEVRVPDYRRQDSSPGIVHLGVGAFHRAHQALFIDELLARGHRDWALTGAGVLEGDRRVRDALVGQDHPYTLVTGAPDGTEEARVIGAITDYLWAPEAGERQLGRLAAPQTRIVSLTITEGGYGVNDVSGVFQPTDPLTVRDLESGGAPASVLE